MTVEEECIKGLTVCLLLKVSLKIEMSNHWPSMIFRFYFWIFLYTTSVNISRCIRQNDLAEKMRGYFNIHITPIQLEDKVYFFKVYNLYLKVLGIPIKSRQGWVYGEYLQAPSCFSTWRLSRCPGSAKKSWSKPLIVDEVSSVQVQRPKILFRQLFKINKIEIH